MALTPKQLRVTSVVTGHDLLKLCHNPAAETKNTVKCSWLCMWLRNHGAVKSATVSSQAS